MNVEFEKALGYIDIENYDKAIESLNAAIMKEEDAGDEIAATQYRCVLGELYANLGMEAPARDELNTVIDFCDEHHVLDQQRNIAKAYLNAFDGIPLPTEVSERNSRNGQRPGDMPLVPKPMQNKAFITRQMNKKRR